MRKPALTKVIDLYGVKEFEKMGAYFIDNNIGDNKERDLINSAMMYKWSKTNLRTTECAVLFTDNVAEMVKRSDISKRELGVEIGSHIEIVTLKQAEESLEKARRAEAIRWLY